MTKEKPKEKNMHAGHRMRVIDSYSKIDFAFLSPHQVLEYILFYVFPRGDVNPLAHRLLDRFGSVQAVIEADENDLAKVYGMNKRSAQLLAGFSKIFNYYIHCKMAKKFSFKNQADIYDYCEELLKIYSQDVLFAVAVDATFHVISKRMLGSSGGGMVAVDPHEIIDFVNESKAARILLCHSHIGDSCVPTENDFLGNNILKNAVLYMNAKFIDHIIVGDDGVFSFEQNKKVRAFD